MSPIIKTIYRQYFNNSDLSEAGIVLYKFNESGLIKQRWLNVQDIINALQQGIKNETA